MTKRKSYSTTEAARILGKSKRTLNYWMTNGKAKPDQTIDPASSGFGGAPAHRWKIRNLRKIAGRTGATINEELLIELGQ